MKNWGIEKMKKFILGIFLLLIIAGCSRVETKEENQSNNDPIIVEKNEQPSDTNLETNDAEIEDPQPEEEPAIDAEKPTENLPLYTLNSNHWGIEPINNANEKVVLLTIDDAPDKYALEMATTLKELNVKAIFFVNGHFIDTDEEKQILKEIYNLGFLIGNHTLSHSMLKDLSEEEQYKEIVELNDEIEIITGERPKFYRAPFGINTEYSKKVVDEEGMLLMNWTYGYDWEKEYQTKEAITDIMVNTPYLKNGANILMHDRKWTNEALNDIVTGIKEKGFEIVDPELIQTLSQ